MTSTINTRSTIPTSTYNPARTAPQHNHRPTGRRIALLGAATALAAVGITAIMQNTGNESIEAPTSFVSSSRTGSPTATEAAAMVRPTVNPGPNFNLPATWTEWSVLAAPVAAAAGPSFEVPATWTEWSTITSPVVNQGPNAEELAAWTERANMATQAAVAGPTIPNVR